MKRKAWIIFGGIVASIILVFLLIIYVQNATQHDSDDYKILTQTNTSDGGHCFVWQNCTSFLFSDVEFGYVSPSGAKYSYPLEIDGFHWKGVRFTEKDGAIHIWQGSWEQAVFYPRGGYFTNILLKCARDGTYGLYKGPDSNFFDLGSLNSKPSGH